MLHNLTLCYLMSILPEAPLGPLRQLFIMEQTLHGFVSSVWFVVLCIVILHRMFSQYLSSIFANWCTDLDIQVNCSKCLLLFGLKLNFFVSCLLLKVHSFISWPLFIWDSLSLNMLFVTLLS